jgi:glycosyltransferase involved in cell wall biosynthesis
MTVLLAPKISVVVPAFNAAHYLPQTLASILRESAATGTGHALEVIMVDDASKDATAEVAAAHAAAGVRYLRRATQGGIGTARNSGVALARGEYLAFLDADDLWPRGRLDALLAVLESAARGRIAFGQIRHFLCPQIGPELRQRLHCPAEPQPGYCAGAMLLRRDDFQRVGPFDETLKVGEFIEWFARARDVGLIPVMIDEVVLERRIHGANQTIRHRADYRDYVHAVKRALDRRRPRAVP